MSRHCPSLGDLDRDRIAVIDRKLAVKLDCSPMSANTANRIRIVAPLDTRRPTTDTGSDSAAYRACWSYGCRAELANIVTSGLEGPRSRSLEGAPHRSAR